MRLLATALVLITLTGCFNALDACPENLNLTEPIAYERLSAIDDYPRVLSTSISQGGEVRNLDIYATGGVYYVEYAPAHFSTRKVYGPFNGSWREDIRCGKD